MADRTGALPQDLLAEQVTLGCMLLDNEACGLALQIVSPGDFYRLAHQQLCTAIATVYRSGQPVDLATVSAELHRTRQLEAVGGGEYLTALLDKVPTVAHVRRYATIVAEKSVLRTIIADAERAITEASAEPENVGQLLNAVAERTHALMQQRLARQYGLVKYEDQEPDFYRIAEAAGLGRRPLSAARLGIGQIDEMIGPLSDQRIIAVKADRGIGKTHLAVNAVYSTAEEIVRRGEDGWVVVFSFESRGIYHRRGLAWRCGVDNKDILRGFDGVADPAAWEDLCTQASVLAHWPIAIEERQQDETHLESQLRLFARRHRIVMGVVDHWQAMTKRPGRSSVEEYEAAAYRLKELADEFAIPFLVLSQVTVNPTTRAVDTRGSRAVQDVATMELRLERRTDGQDYLCCDKMREGVQFAPVAIRVDRATSRFWTQEEWERLVALERQQRMVRQHDN